MAGGVNQTARRVPGDEQSWAAPHWGWAWPAKRRLLYNRASADADAAPWSDRKAYLWWDGAARRWIGHHVADFPATSPPGYRPPPGSTGLDAVAGDEPLGRCSYRANIANGVTYDSDLIKRCPRQLVTGTLSTDDRAAGRCLPGTQDRQLAVRTTAQGVPECA